MRELTGVPPEGVPWDAGIIVALLIWAFVMVAVKYAVDAGRALTHFWVTSPSAKSLSLLQVTLGVLFADAFGTADASVKVARRNARIALSLLSVAALILIVYKLVGPDLANEIVGIRDGKLTW